MNYRIVGTDGKTPAQPQEGRLFAILGLVLSGMNLLFSLGVCLWPPALNPGSIQWQIGNL